MAIHDRRLQGGVPHRDHLAIANTDATTPLRSVFNRIRVFAAGGKIDALFILCHGYAGTNPRLRISADVGGMGLALGCEGVTHANVAQWAQIRGKARSIVIYACAAADTEPGNQYTRADGRYLMGALALHTNADVYAANRIQWYGTYGGLRNGAINFGRWEGDIYRFSGNTGAGAMVRLVPVELNAVLRGAAP